MSRKLTIQDFTPLTGERFRISTAPGGNLALPATELTLIEVRDEAGRFGPHAARDLGRSPFSLVFSGPRSESLPQAYCRMEHPALGAIDHLLVPVFTPRPQVQEYQVVFA